MQIEQPRKLCKKIVRPINWWRRPVIRCPCILLYNNQPVPLKKVKYDVAINGGLANVTLSQEYFNSNPTAINVTYKFPVNEDVVFGGIEAIFRNRKVAGKIKEKTQAKQEFLANKAAGNTVVYAEQLEETEDIMKVELGNFLPNEPLTICFKYMVRLDVMNDVNWAFRIPSTLTPRYNPSGAGGDFWNPFHQVPVARRPLYCGTFVKPVYFAHERYNWEINVSIFWPGGAAKSVRCISHPGAVNVAFNPGVINLSFNPAAGVQYPDKDFELVIEDQELFKNSAQVAMSDLSTITGGSPKYAAMMQFIPSMYDWYAKKGVNLDEGVDLYAEDHNDFLMEKTMAEYIFVLDRSGSMRGGRIEKAKRALLFFLKSLPYNSFFNIISFGTSYSAMFPASVPYNNQNLQTAINQINSFGANMGGTNILQPLQNAFNFPRNPNFQRNLFLLTDGAVSNTQQVFSTIESNCVYNSARVFSIGIGNGCSELLVKRSARVGNGMSVIIADNDNVEGKIINLLNASFTPSLTNFKVDFDPKYICAVSPMPGAHSHITRGEPFTMYALIKNDIETAPNMSTEVKVSFYDSANQKNEVRVFSLNLNGCIVDSSFHKMCVKKVLEGQKRVIKTHYLDPALEKVPNIATKLAVAYQVLSADHTAFICVVHQNNNGVYTPTQNVIVPNIESVDYGNQHRMQSVGQVGGYVNYGMKMKRSMGGRGRGGMTKGRVKLSKNMAMGPPRGMAPQMAPARGAPMMNMFSAQMAPRSMTYGSNATKKRKKKSSISFKKSVMKPQSIKKNREKASKKRQSSISMDEEECDTLSIQTSSTNLPQNQKVSEIVIKQQIRGFWAFDQTFLNSLGVQAAKLAMLQATVADPNALMTIILIAYLQKHGDASTIQIIVNKAFSWLRKQNITNHKQLVQQTHSIV